MSSLFDRVAPWVGALKGSGLKTRLLQPHDEWWDWRLGIHTLGFAPAVGDADTPQWQGHYVPTVYRDIFRLLRHAGLGRDDVFVDLGCGLGRTVFAARWLGARLSVGVDINDELIRGCALNVSRSRRGDRDIQFVGAPAETYAHRDTTVIFMFHPFGSGTMSAVMAGLGAALEAAPRGLRIVYLNPVLDDVLEASGFLRRVDHWMPGRDWAPRSGPYAASFWQSIGTAPGV